MMNEKIFYYNFNKINLWMMLNTALTVTLVYWGIKCPCLLLWKQTIILLATAVFSWLLWGWKYLLKHPAVVIDGDGIKIDYGQKLLWRDVAGSEERDVRCLFRKCRVLVLIPEKNITYHYNFLQKHNGGFTAFAVPLYGLLSPDDEKSVKDEISRHLRKN